MKLKSKEVSAIKSHLRKIIEITYNGEVYFPTNLHIEDEVNLINQLLDRKDGPDNIEDN